MELKPCPFCGGEDVQYRCSEEGEYYMMCYTCYARGPEMMTKRAAEWIWNQRTTKKPG